MSQLLIEIDSAEDEAILLSLLPKLNGRLLSSTSGSSKKGDLKQVITKLRESGVGQKFGDAGEWQRVERNSERILYGREE